MESITKQELTKEQIDKLIYKAFNCEALSIETFSTGCYNAVYGITLDNDRRVVLKVAPDRQVRVMHYEKNIMYTEVSAMQRMNHYPEIPTPVMYYYDSTKTVIDADFFFMEYMPGENYSLVKEGMALKDKDSIDQQIGRINKHINDIIGKKFGYYRQDAGHFATWYEAFSAILSDIIEDAEYYSIDLYAHKDAILRSLFVSKAEFDQVTEPHMIHWDLWDGNIFVSDKQVSGVIDWERCLWGDPLMEYGFRSTVNNPSFNKGYGKTAFSTGEQKRIYWYDLYLYLTMLVEYYSRQYNNAGFYQNAWKHYVEAIENLNI